MLASQVLCTNFYNKFGMVKQIKLLISDVTGGGSNCNNIFWARICDLYRTVRRIKSGLQRARYIAWKRDKEYT
jgi:hypothetical protein